MKNLHFLATYSPEELREMLAEAERALKLVEDNPKLELTSLTSFRLDGDEILTMDSTILHEVFVLELRMIINELETELQTPVTRYAKYKRPS